MIILQILHTEALKNKHTVMSKVFLAVPLVLTFANLFMIRTARAGDPELVFNVGVSVSFTLLSMVSPLLIGLFAGIMGEQEYGAGNFQTMRNSRYRELNFVLKILYLILVFIALSLAVWIIDIVGIKIFYHPSEMDVLFAFKALLVFITGSLFWIPLCIYIGFTYGIGASMGLGIFGTFFVTYLSSIPLLSENTWRFIPCAWSVKLTAAYYNFKNPLYGSVDMPLDLTIQILVFVLLLIIFVFWFSKWEGRD